MTTTRVTGWWKHATTGAWYWCQTDWTIWYAPNRPAPGGPWKLAGPDGSVSGHGSLADAQAASGLR